MLTIVALIVLVPLAIIGVLALRTLAQFWRNK
jgi:hypothetical protein